jgi:hypothetical protein
MRLQAIVSQPQNLVARNEPRIDQGARPQAKPNQGDDECDERPCFSRPQA